MFFNEDYVKTANTRVNLPVKGDYNKLDIMTEKYFSGFSHDGSLHINLLPNQSAIYIFGDCAEFPKEDKPEWEQILTPSYKLSLADYRSLSHFEDYGYFNEFFNITSSEIKPDFAGKMRYTFDFYVKKDGRITYLDLGYVGQNATLFINEKDIGIRISPPYRFDITDALKDGKNHAVITVSNTLVRISRDFLSKNLQLSPSGLIGDVKLIKAK